jgi:hypothetical protein
MTYKDPTKQKEFQHNHYLKYKEHYNSKAKKRREEGAEFINSLKTKCSACGYNECKQALQFHHTDDNKLFGISSGRKHSRINLLKELDKCVLLCANCHAKKHCTI